MQIRVELINKYDPSLNHFSQIGKQPDQFLDAGTFKLCMDLIRIIHHDQTAYIYILIFFFINLDPPEI